MAVTVASLQAAFKPEFDNVDSTLIQTCIDEAKTRVDIVNWRTKVDMGINYLAAHLLSIRAGGQNARWSSSGGGSMTQHNLSTTVYGQEYLFLARTISYGGRVAGSTP